MTPHNEQCLRHGSKGVDLASIALGRQLCHLKSVTVASTCGVAIADDPLLRCPFTLLLTGSQASMLDYDGEGTTTLGAGLLIHTFYQLTGSLTKGSMQCPA